MKSLLLLVPMAAILLSSCGMQQAMDNNRYAIQRSTDAINRNVDALNRVTENLKEMQQG